MGGNVNLNTFRELFMGKDLNFVCERCSFRLAKKAILAAHPISKEMIDEFKAQYKSEHGQKPAIKTVLTSCLGPCPNKAISYIKSRDGVLSEDLSYDYQLEKDEIKKLFF